MKKWNFPPCFAAVCVLAGLISAAQAGFTVSIQQDTATPATLPGLVAYNVYVLGSEGDRMAAFDASFTGNLFQVWAAGEEGWTATPWRKDLDALGGKYRNDSHFRYLASELLSPGGSLAETNDLSEEESLGQGYGTLWTSATQGVINLYQNETAHLARIVLPQGQTAMLNWKVWNQQGERITQGLTIIPEPATTMLLLLGGAQLWRQPQTPNRRNRETT